MRLRHAKLIVVLIVVANLILFYYSWKSMLWKNIAHSLALTDEDQAQLKSMPPALKLPKYKVKSANKNIQKSITVVFRCLYTFENDLKASIDSLLDVIPNMSVLVLQDGVPYPPLAYERNTTGATTNSTVRFLSLDFDIQKPPELLNPLSAIHTKYVLFMPDSVRVSNKSLLQKILREINGYNHAVPKLLVNSILHATKQPPALLIVPFAGNIKSFNSCLQINLDLPNWTIQYVAVNNSRRCDLFLQKHAILIDVDVLKEMSEPFATPFPEMFYIQAKLAKLSKTIFPLSFQDGRRLFSSYHTKQRRMEIRRRQFKAMYKKLQIKRVVRQSHKVVSKIDLKDSDISGPQHNLVLDTQFSSSNFSLPKVTEIDLIGCERMTKSCIGSVLNNRPFYLYLGRHTPPCCLDKLRSTFNHVLEEFENVGIRYWLDNYALRTAIEINGLSPDAYDIDISFNVNDLERSNAMKKSQSKPYVDNEGFYWIKATDGHYFRVQFSKINHVGVNLLPFEINGNEVRPNGFFGWKAKKFSADYLHPMSTVLFLGKNIMCPNNVREFLESKNIELRE